MHILIVTSSVHQHNQGNGFLSLLPLVSNVKIVLLSIFISYQIEYHLFIRVAIWTIYTQCMRVTILKIEFNSFDILFQIPKWRPNSSDWSCRSHGGGQGTPRWLGCKVTDIAATGTSKTSICCCKIKGKFSSNLAYERWEKSLVFRKGNPRNESNVQWINIINLEIL